MKKASALLLTGVFAFTASLSQAQETAADIVKKHNEAVGGAKNWSKVTSLKKEGTMNMMGMDFPVTYTIVRDKGMRQDFSVMGTDCYVILTPTGGWAFIPPQGHTKPEPMPAEQTKDAAELLQISDPLMTASDKKYTIELTGKEDIDGKPTHKLKVVDAEKKETTYFVDAATYYLVREVSTANVQGQDMEVTKNYSDFKKLPEGIVLAMKEDAGDQGSTSFTKVEANTVKDDSIFKVAQ